MKGKNSALFLFILLGALTAFGPFVTDMYLPTLPSMVGYFDTQASMVQLGLTSSMIGLALGQLFFRPVERPVRTSVAVAGRHVALHRLDRLLYLFQYD